jgi:hypothetical protein
MIKSSLVKWAVAALLAVPAAATLGASAPYTTITKHHHRTLSHTHHKHRPMTGTRHHRKLHHKGTGHASFSSHKHRHSTLSTSAAHPTLKITKMPPTIDGMNT